MWYHLIFFGFVISFCIFLFRYVERMFNELEEFRAFELLRSGLDRSKYLLVKEAKIIAMTCTHAALKRKELVDMGSYSILTTNYQQLSTLYRQNKIKY